MRTKEFEVDQFRREDWEPDKKEDIKRWHQFHEEFQKDRNRPNPSAFSPRPNLIDSIRPFVNKRGVRDRNFLGDDHEVKLTQLEEVPGSAKLVYRNLKLQHGEMVDVYITSRSSMKKDIEKISKKLYKKAKKLNI